MKHATNLTLLILASFFLITACKKDTEKTPDYPQLIGAWEGQTSQVVPISLSVTNRDGILYISYYKFQVSTNNGYQSYEQYNSNGIASISSTQFKIILGSGTNGEAYIDGIFNVQNMTLTGNFAVYANGNNIDKFTGSYDAALKQ